MYASKTEAFRTWLPLRPVVLNKEIDGTDPMRWLSENSGNRYAVSKVYASKALPPGKDPRPRAALISLVRNSELEGIMQSMRQLEYRWNKKYQYPWVFFNDEPFDENFKAATQNLTSAKCFFEVVPAEHWSLPDWIDKGRFMNSLEYLGTIGVGKGWMASYHHMCRWNSGFFYKHPRLQEYDWYWRVEPDVRRLRPVSYIHLTLL
jgi:alpha 1,2-mannosyltransferase